MLDGASKESMPVPTTVWQFFMVPAFEENAFSSSSTTVAVIE